MANAILKLNGLTRHFGGVVAVDRIDVEIPSGKIIGLIGPNGAGKTTLLQLVSGVQRPDEGSIFFRDEDITAKRAHERARMGIGRTFQIVKPLVGMTVLENVTVAALFGKNGHARNLAKAQAAATEVLHRVGLSQKKEQYASSLTLADTKRLELAKALATEPDLMLLDEVMAGLNPSEVSVLMQLIKELKASHLTLIVVEHVMKAIMGISDEILVLHHGQKIAYGTPQEISTDEEVIRAYLGHRYARAH
jgi:branched-chain amino acid transport system ATP-binding protein